ISDVVIRHGTVVFHDRVGPESLRVPRRFDSIDTQFGFSYEPVRFSIDIARLSFQGSDPEFVVRTLTGSVAVRNDTLFLQQLAAQTGESAFRIDGSVQSYLSRPRINVGFTSPSVSFQEIARIVPALSGIPLRPSIDLMLEGPLERLQIALNGQSSAG